MKDGYYKSQRLEPINDVPQDDKINIVRFQLMPKNDHKVVLIREDKTPEVLSL
jgi:hypothetical protein